MSKIDRFVWLLGWTIIALIMALVIWHIFFGWHFEFTMWRRP